VEIWLFMLPQVNDGCRLPASLIHHESDSAHENNLVENARKQIQNKNCNRTGEPVLKLFE
jgi:hypothetical protein